jgi:two-component sensor histidine kinase
MLSSLLEMQAYQMEDEKSREMAEEGQQRVMSMALIHQRLYQNDDLLVHFDEYIHNLVSEISDIYFEQHEPTLQVDVPKVAFDIDTAIPLGLIVNELVTNAFKYGFDKEAPQLSVNLAEKGDGEYQITVKDNGQGMPTDFDLSKAKSLGMRLVHRLADQLQGGVEYAYDAGRALRFHLKMPWHGRYWLRVDSLVQVSGEAFISRLRLAKDGYF